MKILITTILFLKTLSLYAQFDFELYINLTSKENLMQHQKISRVTVYKSEKKGEKTITQMQEFLNNGYPAIIIDYDDNEQMDVKTEFIYDSLGYIQSIEKYKDELNESSTVFEVNQMGLITAYTEYVYSSYNREKLFLWKTLLEYNPNLTIKQTITQKGFESDSSEINLYNANGVKTKSILNKSGLSTTKIEYVYNNDSTVMLEQHYEDDSTIYTTIIHNYKDKKEIERLDPTISEKPFYWKFDNLGRVIETNEAFFYITYYKYNSDGFLTNKTMEEVLFDPDTKEPPRKIEYIYEYQ